MEKVAFWAKMLAKLSWQEVGMRVMEGCNLCSSFGGFFVKLNTPQYNLFSLETSSLLGLKANK